MMCFSFDPLPIDSIYASVSAFPIPRAAGRLAQGFTEDDPANFFGSFYSTTKGMVEKLLKEYENTCVLRVRMPISDDLASRNFITKVR